MSTKVAETCSTCNQSVAPTDKAVSITHTQYQFVYKMWRYECQCGNIWANMAQRIHNNREFDRAYQKAKEYSAGWMF